MGNNLLDGILTKEVTKFKSELENSKHVVSFNILKAVSRNGGKKFELSFIKIPVRLNYDNKQ